MPALEGIAGLSTEIIDKGQLVGDIDRQCEDLRG
jgi:hypothetical protein